MNERILVITIAAILYLDTVSLFWHVGLTVAVTFLVVNLVMEASGWAIGAWGAAARYTMLTVMFTSNPGAALAGGARGSTAGLLARSCGYI